MKGSPILRRFPLISFYALALAWTWLLEWPLVAAKQGWIAPKIPFAIHYLASLGPAVASIIVTSGTSGKSGLRELWSRVVRWRAGRMWVAIAIFSPFVMFAGSVLIVRIFKGGWPHLRFLGQANYVPYLGPGVFFLWLASFGFGEEIGWRGFALPRLQRSMGASQATFRLALMWAIWHVPAFLYLDTLRQVGLIIVPGFLIGVLFGAVIFTWIYNGTGGSVFYVAVWHALFDMFTASKVAQDIIPMAMTAMVIIGVLIITRVDKPWNFHRLQKQVL